VANDFCSAARSLPWKGAAKDAGHRPALQRVCGRQAIFTISLCPSYAFFMDSPLPCICVPPITRRGEQNHGGSLEGFVRIAWASRAKRIRDQAMQPLSVHALPSGEALALGGKRRWWLTREQRLEKQLKKLGHQVIFVEGR